MVGQAETGRRVVPELVAADELLAEAGPEMLDMCESDGGVFASAPKSTRYRVQGL